MKKKIVFSILSVIAFSIINGTSAIAENQIVKEITPFVNKSVKTPAPMVFIDGERYAQLSDDKRTVDIYDTETGKKLETVFDVGYTREAQIGEIEGFTFSKDFKKLIVWNDSEPIYRRSFPARYYYYDRHSRILKPVSDEFERTQSPVFSPDGRMIAFVYENNIYIRNLDYKTQVPVTVDGKKGEIINGATDWTYEEEFGVTSLLTFTNDNTALCYIKFNESEVPYYSLPIYAGYCDRKEQYALYPGELKYKYPVAGATNSTVSLHSFEISLKKTKDITFTDKTIEYIPRIYAIPASESLLVTTLNRDQNRMEVYSVNPKTTSVTSVFVEKSNAWILPETYEKMRIVNDGFVIMSPRTGRTHLYKYAFNGTLTRTITQGDFDVTDFYGLDETGNAFFQAALPSPLERTVLKSDSKGIRTTLSPENGTASAVFSPDCRVAMLNFSNTVTPPVYTIINQRGKELRLIEKNETEKQRALSLPQKEFVKIPGDNGLEFNAYLIKPKNFDPSRKYPVVMYQYSGPGSQTVLNRWDVSWEHFFAEKGFIIFCLDGRGTGGRGTDFMFSVYKNLGYYETIDQLAGARWLARQGWVDAAKIGMHGWSYGGYETLMCLEAQDSPFACGVAVAPVTDWRLYDSIYAERYMLTPQQNFDGYNHSAPLNFTNRMKSELLLMYGTADDNVHPANTLEYAAALQYEGTLFDMMVFPNKNHSIYGCNARALVYGNMFRFFSNRLAEK